MTTRFFNAKVRAAAALVTSEAWVADPSAGVAPTENRLAREGLKVAYLRMRVHDFRRGPSSPSSIRVASNAGEGWMKTHALLFFTSNAQRKKQASLYDRGNGGSPGVYASTWDAQADSVRFRLWVQLGFPNMQVVLQRMKTHHPVAFATFKKQTDQCRLSAVRTAAREDADARRRERKRRRTEMKTVPRLTADAAKFRALEARLAEGVQKTRLHHSAKVVAHLDGDADDKAFELLTERTRAYINEKARGCRLYFARLAERAEACVAAVAARAAAAASGDTFSTDAADISQDDGEVYDSEDEEDDDVDEVRRRRLRQQNVHAIADQVVADAGVGVNGRVLRGWAKEFERHGTFLLDGRGLTSPEHLLDDEDIRDKVRRFMLNKAKVRGEGTLSVQLFHEHVNKELLPELMWEDKYRDIMQRTLSLNDDGSSFTISKSTAHGWMVRCGAKRQPHKKGYYTDVHEREDVIADRIEYLKVNQDLNWRTSMWVVLTSGEFERLHAEKEDEQDASWAEKPFFFMRDDCQVVHEVGPDTATHVEIHVDQLEDTAARDKATVSVRWTPPPRAKERCAWGHDAQKCRCHMNIIRCGQDESIFKAYALPRGEWVICGVLNARKKSDGVGEMASVFVDEVRGIMMTLTEEELDKVNAFRANRKDGGDTSPLDASPGARFLQYGKNREGYWGYNEIARQVADVIDVYETIYPEHQVVIEVDWSSGHAKAQDDGLAVVRMNVNIGQNRMKTKTKTFIPKTLNTGIADGGVVIDTGCVKAGGELHNIRIGGRQHFAFGRRDKINPFEVEKYSGADAETVVGEAKGMRQILWERGFDVSEMKGEDMRKALAECSDFKSEVGALERSVIERGHILLMSPKAHPELAGLGIEYCWGKAKSDFRRNNAMDATRGTVVEDLHKRTVKSLMGIDVLRVRRFARKTREYMRAYARVHGLFGWHSERDRLAGHEAVEKFVKKARTHRCILDQDFAFATA